MNIGVTKTLHIEWITLPDCIRLKLRDNHWFHNDTSKSLYISDIPSSVLLGTDDDVKKYLLDNPDWGFTEQDFEKEIDINRCLDEDGYAGTVRRILALQPDFTDDFDEVILDIEW